MKPRFLLSFFCFFIPTIFMWAQGPITPINNGVLRSNINANGFKLTNLPNTVLADWHITDAISSTVLTNYVLNTTTVNSHALTGNVTINAADVGAPVGSGSSTGTNTGDQVISDATITTTDITTNNVSTTKHGFAPKLPNDSTKYLNGAGVYTVPPDTNSGGTVTSFSAGDLSPLFTTSEATITTTPALTFTLSTAAANTFFGNGTGSSATPTFMSASTARTALGLGTLATQSGTFSGTSSGTNTGDQTTVSGNAGTATALATGRTLAITGDLAWTSPSFDGTGNVTAAGTLATVASAGTTGSSTAIPVITINAKGLTTTITTAAVVAPAGTLSGVTLTSGVTASSLTSFGSSPTLSTPVFTGLPTGTGVASAGTASTLASRDANANLTANNWIGGYATTTTAAGTTTLTVGSAYVQFFTGSSTQTVTLPVASTLTLGHQFIIANNSTASVTVNSSGANAVIVLAGGTSATITCILASGTTAASWNASYFGDAVASGKKLLVSNTLTLAGTDASTLNIGTGGTLGTNAYTSTAYAPLASPAFTGAPAAPTAAVNTNTTQLATTAFVLTQAGNKQLQTADGTVGTYTFTIPSGYTSIRILVNGRSSAAVDGIGLRVQFNSDTGANYDTESVYWEGSTTGAASANISGTYAVIGWLPGANATASYSGSVNTSIPGYANTAFYKTVISQSAGRDGGLLYMDRAGGNWKNTTAITSATIFLGSGNFVSGSTIEVVTE